MANYPTPHIDAKPGDFGQTVLMPGDPLRAKFIAENFLQNAVLVNNVRGIQGYTGIYDSTKISVMASGMGMPSIGIYSWELYTVFGVENIMRIGSTGALQDSIKLRDIVIGQGACTDSNWASQYHLAGTFAPIADFHMLETCVETAKEMGVAYHVGNILSSDRFYGDDGDMPEGWQANYGWQKMGVLAVEMEAAAESAYAFAVPVIPSPLPTNVPATMSVKAAITNKVNNQQNSMNNFLPVLPMYFSIIIPIDLPSFLTDA